MKRVLLSLPLLMGLAGCATKPPPRPRCGPIIAPIAGKNLVISVPVGFGYTPKDESESAVYLRQTALAKLNELGAPQSNRFELQNGQELNFIFAFWLANYNETYTGNLKFDGWGQGRIQTFHSKGAYNDPKRLIQDLLGEAYEYIRLGWHDDTPNCVKF